MSDKPLKVEIDDEVYAKLKAKAEYWETTPEAYAVEILREWYDRIRRDAADRDRSRSR